MTKSKPSNKKNKPKVTSRKSVKPAISSAVRNQPKRHSMTLLVAGSLLLMLMVCFIHRQQIGLKFDKIRFGYAARTAFDQEYDKLAGPLQAFGMTKNPKFQCIVENIYLYTDKQLQCSVEEQPYKVVGTTPASKAYYIAQAAKLDSLLKQSGWTENQNVTPTYEQWIKGITSGKDWYADEGAYKNVGSAHCWMDAYLAFSNPRPAAFSLHMGCSAPILQKFKDEL